MRFSRLDIFFASGLLFCPWWTLTFSRSGNHWSQIVLIKAYCRYVDLGLSACGCTRFFRPHGLFILLFLEFKVVWRTLVVLWPPKDIGNLMHLLLLRVHVPDINMDLLSLPSGFENIVMIPWQWIPPPPMTPPRLLAERDIWGGWSCWPTSVGNSWNVCLVPSS